MSVSGKGIDEKCEMVISAMRELGICGDVTPNVSVDSSGYAEKGCRILIASKPHERYVRLLWENLRDAAGLKCAHVQMKENTSGCYFDVYGETRCPDKC